MEPMKTHLLLNTPAAQRSTDIDLRLAGGCRVLLLSAAMLATVFGARAQNDTTPATATNSPPQVESPTPPTSAATVATNAATPVDVASTATGLNLNFRNAPIDLVLEHLSKAAGFIIQMDSPVRGSVSVIGQNLTKEEAIDLLNTELNKNGYAAIRSGTRTLRILDKNTAKSSNNPVRISNDPDSIPNNDEMVTQIIPIRYVEAQQLVSDLSPFVSSQATIIANQAGNSIIITDTQANIRHLVEIVKAIDSSAEDVTEVKVFKLQYADPTEMATLLSGLFPDQSGTAQAPIRFGNRGGGGFGGRGGFGGGGFGGGFNPFAGAFGGGGNQAGGNNQNDRIKKRNQVVAVADGRTSSVIVTATKDLMEQITEMIDQLDHPGKAQHMEVIAIHNADSQEILSVLQDTVGGNTSRNTRNTQTSPFQNRIQQNQNNTGNNRSTLGNNNNRGGGGGGNRGTGGFGF
jgi:type II secretory pathway component GspD/PulD (secretin)